MTTNGQSPFVTIFMYLDKDDEYVEENAMIIEEILKQRLQGIKNELAANHPNVTVTETIYLDQLEMLKKQIVAEQVGVTPEELAAAEAGERSRRLRLRFPCGPRPQPLGYGDVV